MFVIFLVLLLWHNDGRCAENTLEFPLQYGRFRAGEDAVYVRLLCTNNEEEIAKRKCRSL